MDQEKLADAARVCPAAWAQRLGYLMKLTNTAEHADRLARYISENDPVPVPLNPSLPRSPAVNFFASFEYFINKLKLHEVLFFL